MSKVFVFGGTGLLGRASIDELVSRGYQAKTIALDPLKEGEKLPEGVDLTIANMFDMSDDEIIKVLSDCDAFIYAAGKDERVVPKKPAFKFFYQENVLPTQRFARLSARAGIKKFVIFNSFFSEFAIRRPDMELFKEPYVCTRLMQEQVAFCEGEGYMDVMSLRLPYIFGDTRGLTPVWKLHTDGMANQDKVFALRGVTAAVTVKQVAQAAVGAIENGEHRGQYPISTFNLPIRDLFEVGLKFLGQEDRTQIIDVSLDQVRGFYESLNQQAEQNGVEHGMNMVKSAWATDEDFSLDTTDINKLLGIKSDNERAKFEEAMEISARMTLEQQNN